jgi:putative effector of murein hydrolase
MLHPSRLADGWLPIAVAIIVGTVLAIAAAALMFQWLVDRAQPYCSMRSHPFFELWVYLAATPRAGLTLTLIMYAAGWTCYTRMRMHLLEKPGAHCGLPH